MGIDLKSILLGALGTKILDDKTEVVLVDIRPYIPTGNNG